MPVEQAASPRRLWLALEREHDRAAPPAPGGAEPPPGLPAGAVEVTRARFVIGRGKHCDLVINSGMVSREHAAVVREGPDFFIEDLGSSAGTWHKRRRYPRRKIEDGDVYELNAQVPVRCFLR